MVLGFYWVKIGRSPLGRQGSRRFNKDPKDFIISIQVGLGTVQIHVIYPMGI